MHSDLRIERELTEFKIFEERSRDAASFEDVSFHVGIEHHRVPHRLLQLSRTVVDVQARVPKTSPVHLLEILQINTIARIGNARNLNRP